MSDSRFKASTAQSAASSQCSHNSHLPALPTCDEMITVAIVDDNRLVREALASMLDRLPDLRVVAAGVADPAFMDEAKPDVVLLDVGLARRGQLGRRRRAHQTALRPRRSS